MNLILEKYLFILLIGFCFSAEVYAQKYELTLVTGECFYQPTGQTKWKQLERYEKDVWLDKTSKIKVGKNTQLFMLENESKKVFLIDKSGFWKVEQFTKQELPSVIYQYFSFLSKELTHKHKSLDEYALQYLQQKGLVSRGNICNSYITPAHESILDSVAYVFKWHTEVQTKSYILAFYKDLDKDTESFWKREVSDTTFCVNFEELQLKSGEKYFWSVYPTGISECIRYEFRLPKLEEMKQLELNLSELKPYLTQNIAMNAFLKAGVYEQNHFYKKADNYYYIASKKEPQNSLFKESYALFLARNGNIDKAKLINK